MSKSLNVLIIGAGNIGAFFDSPQSEAVLTHAHAFSKIDKFKLLGFVDASEEKGKAAAKLWNVNYYSSVEEAFNRNTIDIVSICVPDEYHFEVFTNILKFPIKLIFLEKPIAKNLEEAEKLIKLAEQYNIKCLVNYSRRFVDEFKVLKENISNNHYGKYICGNGYYGKGILHNGSHLIDFLTYLFGDVEDTKSFRYEYDFFKDDPSVSAILTFKNGSQFIIQNISCNNYTIFELELMFERKRIRIIDSGFRVEEYSLEESSMFRGYINLFKDKDYVTNLGKSMENAALNIYEHLQFNKNLQCTLLDAYRDMEICQCIKEGAKHE